MHMSHMSHSGLIVSHEPHFYPSSLLKTVQPAAPPAVPPVASPTASCCAPPICPHLPPCLSSVLVSLSPPKMPTCCPTTMVSLAWSLGSHSPASPSTTPWACPWWRVTLVWMMGSSSKLHGPRMCCVCALYTTRMCRMLLRGTRLGRRPIPSRFVAHSSWHTGQAWTPWNGRPPGRTKATFASRDNLRRFVIMRKPSSAPPLLPALNRRPIWHRRRAP